VASLITYVINCATVTSNRMKGLVINIENATKENSNFRRVLYTAKNSQLVVMSLMPKEEIGEEIHQLDQFLRIETGVGKAILDGVEHDIAAEWAIVVPAGAKHNIINTSETDTMKLYTVYSPPNHADGTVHATKAEAEAKEEHFDGKTTE
jgi:mannose-6-phosphate isomerase-like protein (cupin superfamily)